MYGASTFLQKDILKQVRDFAEKAHGGQTRKYTAEQYIVHPVSVMELCRQHTARIPVLAAALLHDVLEDTTVSREQLQDFLKGVMSYGAAMTTARLVTELTDVYTRQQYPAWNRDKRKSMEAKRIAGTSPDAQTIKYADIIDNSMEIARYDKLFGRKFLLECKALLGQARKGNKDLYRKAVNIVTDELKKIRLLQ